MDGSQDAGLVDELRRALDGGAPDASDTLVARAEEALAATVAGEAAAARRRAVLAGLADLGYEIWPSMTTALVERGRVVVRKPGTQDYGVELAAPGAGERVQVRLAGSVSPASRRDALRDRDAETTWCGDLDRLRSLVGEAGGEIVVERALGAGVEPVKTVAMEPASGAERVDVAPAAAGRAS